MFEGVVTQHARRMRLIILLAVARLSLQHFCTLSRKFSEKVIDYKMYVLIICTNFVCNISHSKEYSARYHKCIRLQVIYRLFLSGVNGKLDFFDTFFERHTNVKFHKILSVRSRVVPCGRNDRLT